MSYEKFTKGVGLIGIINLLTALSGIILLPILTKTLSTSGYGIWAQLLVTISLLTPLAMLGLPTTTVRFLAGEKDKEKIREGYLTIFFTVFFSGLLLSTLLFFLSDFLASAVFKVSNVSNLIKLASALIFITALYEISLAYYRTFEQIKKYSILTLITRYGEVCLVGCLVLLEFGVVGAIIALVIVRGSMFIIAFSLISKQIGFKLPKFLNLRSYLAYSLPLTPNSIIIWIIHSSDRYIIGYLIGISAVGIYSAAYTIGNLIYFFVTPIGFILFPTISKLYEENNMEETKKYLEYSFKYFLLLALPSAFGLSVLAEQLLRILTTSDFVVGSIVVPFVVFGVVMYGVFQICIFIIYLVKKTKLNIILLGIPAVLNIILNLILIPYIGILGAAIATLITYGVLAVSTALISFKYIKLNIDLVSLLKIILASVMIALLILVINPITLTQVLLSIGIGAAVYSALVILLGAVTTTELRFFWNLLLPSREFQRLFD